MFLFIIGSEYYNYKVKSFLESRGVKLISTYSVNKCSYCEAAVKTIKTRLARVFTQRGNHKYLDILPQITKSYNATIHSSIGMAPRSVNKNNSDQVWRKLYGKYAFEKRADPKYSVGMTMRISRVKDTFEKGTYFNA